MTLTVTQQQLSEVRRAAENAYPHECCGILMGRDGTVLEVRPAANVAPDERHRDRYEIDPRALLAAQREGREQGMEMIGCHHSHPDNPAIPSTTDKERGWEGLVYLIVSVRSGQAAEVRAWEFVAGEAREVVVTII